MSETKKSNTKPIIGISVGDINGIGPEVIMKALRDPRILSHFTPVIYANSKIFTFYRKQLQIDQFHFHQINRIDELQEGKINVLNVWKDHVDITPGKANATGGTYAVKSLQASVDDLKQGKIDALTTAPLSKDLVQSESFNFPGHTEYLTKEAGVEDSLMFLVHEDLRVGVATGHLPISQVSANLTQDTITKKIDKMLRSLKVDFGIKKPKIAVMGLNPHAGENGLLGKEEEEVINPVIHSFKEKNQLVEGTFPADGFFGMNLQTKFDGILAMYHDQGLIPFKTLAFENGVNFTAGLPIIRTSPDHGTAFDIAGKNLADEASFRNALYVAQQISKERMAQT